MNMNSISHIFREQWSDEHALNVISKILQKINRIAGTGFIPSGKNEREGAVDYTWIDVAPNAVPARVVWCDDSVMNAQYVEVAGATPETFVLINNKLEQELPLMSFDDLLNAADKNDDPGAIARLALAARENYDKRVADRVVTALFNPHPAFRQQAQMAVFLLQWSEFKCAIDEALGKETDKELLPGLQYLSQLYGKC
jgi:hypothetical protein